MDQLKYENELWQKYEHLCGIDEVGRGCLAGPVVACAVIMPRIPIIDGVKDSKLLTKKKREDLEVRIKELAVAYKIIEIDNNIIDKVNILQATIQAMTKAVNLLDQRPDCLLVDALILPLEIPQEGIIHGDLLSYSIACASILAKVYRDKLMDYYDQIYPKYDLAKNKGYPTLRHREALLEYGVTPIHRRSFRPVSDAINSSNK